MAIVVFFIFSLGYLIKFIFSLFFPELILNEEGVKLLGRKLIFWKEIKKIKTEYNGNSKITIKITKNNSKKIIENLNLSNLNELKIFIRSYRKQYRVKKF